MSKSSGTRYPTGYCRSKGLRYGRGKRQEERGAVGRPHRQIFGLRIEMWVLKDSACDTLLVTLEHDECIDTAQVRERGICDARMYAA